MKQLLSIFSLVVTLGIGSSALAVGQWKQVVNDVVFPNAPSFKQYFINDNQIYQEIRAQVMMGDLRIANSFVVTESGMQLPLWQLNMDYRSGFTQYTNFSPSKLQGLRFDLRPLGKNPVNLSVWVR